jgi:hypothetical protein
MGCTALAADGSAGATAAALAATLLDCWNDKVIGTVTRFSPAASAKGAINTRPRAAPLTQWAHEQRLLFIVDRITKQLTR